MKTQKNKQVYENNLLGKGSVSLVLIPDSVEEISNIIKFSDLDIISRGAGTSFTGACSPENSIIIDMQKMNKVLEIDQLKKTIWAEAGATVEMINLELNKYNLECPILPLFPSIQTIGGLIALNTNGLRSLKYGGIKNWVDSLEVINTQGLKKLLKADIDDFVGLEGITGIITKVKLRVTTKKIRTFNILKSLSLSDLIIASKKLKLDHEVSMVFLMDKSLAELSGLESKYHLFIEYESNKGQIKEDYQKYFNMVLNSYRLLSFKGFNHLEDPKFFGDSVLVFMNFLEKNNIPFFSDLGTSVVYFALKSPNQEFLKEVQRLRGKITDSLGFGLTKKLFVEQNDLKVIRNIKQRNDPRNRFNKNKLIDFQQIIIGEPVEEKKEQIIKEETKKEEILITHEATTPSSNNDPSGNLGFRKGFTPSDEMQDFIEKEKAKETKETPIIADLKLEESKEEFPRGLEKTEDTSDNSRGLERGEAPSMDKIINAIDQNAKVEKKQTTKEEEEMIRKILGGNYKKDG